MEIKLKVVDVKLWYTLNGNCSPESVELLFKDKHEQLFSIYNTYDDVVKLKDLLVLAIKNADTLADDVQQTVQRLI